MGKPHHQPTGRFACSCSDAAAGRGRSPAKASRRLVLSCVLQLILLGQGILAAPPSSPSEPLVSEPLTPELALAEFAAVPEVRVELVASEPDVVDPVAMAFDEAGRLWVVEMRDYPVAGQPPRSRVVILRDDDHDGRYRQTSVFATGLSMANGILPWDGGVLVTLGGEIEWLKDLDGDEVADLREVWFRGFAEENPQLRASHPTWGVDARVYVANGLRGGQIQAARPAWAEKSSPLSIRGFGFAFNPRTGQSQAITGHGQFGLSLDDFGNRFFCSNRNPCMHVVIEDRYARRAGDVRLGATTADVAAAAEASRVFPISRFWTTSNLHEGQFTAACGVTFYRGNRLPPRFQQQLFVCEPTGNLVHCEQLQPDGATFRSTPMVDRGEFLASRDEWFRPVNLAEGPDGALYVVDMYRRVIEHPDWMPLELRNRPDLTWGADRGRIYRLVPVAGDRDAARQQAGVTAVEAPLLGLDRAALLQTLGHPNGWHRDTAARLLYQSATGTISSPVDSTTPRPRAEAELADLRRELARLAGDSTVTSEGRARAVGLLHALGGLSPDVIRGILTASEQATKPALKRFTLAVAESQMAAQPAQEGAAERSANVLEPESIARLLQSGDRGLLFQLALSAGELPASERAFLARVLVRYAADPWIRTAVLVSSEGIEFELDQAAAKWHATASAAGPAQVAATTDVPVDTSDAGMVAFVTELWRLIGVRYGGGQEGIPPRKLQTLVARLAMAPAPTLAAVAGLARGLRTHDQPIDSVLAATLSADSVATFNARALAIAQDTRLNEQIRGQAIAYLAFVPAAAIELAPLVTDQPNLAVSVAAMEALVACRDKAVGELLLAAMPRQTPRVRGAVVNWLLSDSERTAWLLEAIDGHRLAKSDVSLLQANQLRTHPVAEIRQAAKRLWSAPDDADTPLDPGSEIARRQQNLARYRAQLPAGDAARGRAVFRQHCASCHRVDRWGVDVAPDISDSRVKTPEQLLEAILDPNRSVDNNYFAYQLVTTAGEVRTGILVGETATELTLREAGGKAWQVAKREVDQLQSSGLSLMPAGFETLISPEAMADLVAFLKNWRYLDGQIPGLGAARSVTE